MLDQGLKQCPWDPFVFLLCSAIPLSRVFPCSDTLKFQAHTLSVSNADKTKVFLPGNSNRVPELSPLDQFHPCNHLCSIVVGIVFLVEFPGELNMVTVQA